MKGKRTMPSNYKTGYYVDLVFCIDATGSMSNVINMVKNNALNFYQDIMKAMEKKAKEISQLRISIIAFRDYKYDGENALLQTDFFTLPDDTELFKRCVTGIEASGGGDDPEDGLEALAFAIRSPWDQTEGVKHRQVIVVWTDAPTHELGFGSSAENYPTGMPRDFGELSVWWGDRECSPYMDFKSKRLIIYAPDQAYWNTISDNWDNVLHYTSVAGKGMEEYEYEQIIDTITSTIAMQ